MFEGFDRIDISVESSISYVQEGKTPLADFFNAFYVIPFDSEDHKKKYAVLDFRKIDSKDRKQALEAFKKQTGEGFADSMKQHAKTSSPGSVIYYHFSKDQIDAQIQYKGKIQGNIQVFYEDPKTLDALYGSFSSNKRMRLTTLQDQPPGSKWEKGDICRELKVDLGSRGGWSYGVGRVDRERTAAVDRSEFILICRLRMQHILEKGIKDLSLNDISNLQAYVEGVYASDLAGLPASYSKDPVFVQAFHQIKSIEQKLKEGIATQKYIKRLQEGLNIITKNKPINSNRAKLVITEIRDVLSKWNSNITEFLEFIDT